MAMQQQLWEEVEGLQTKLKDAQGELMKKATDALSDISLSTLSPSRSPSRRSPPRAMHNNAFALAARDANKATVLQPKPRIGNMLRPLPHAKDLSSKVTANASGCLCQGRSKKSSRLEFLCSLH